MRITARLFPRALVSAGESLLLFYRVYTAIITIKETASACEEKRLFLFLSLSFSLSFSEYTYIHIWNIGTYLCARVYVWALGRVTVFVKPSMLCVEFNRWNNAKMIYAPLRRVNHYNTVSQFLIRGNREIAARHKIANKNTWKIL